MMEQQISTKHALQVYPRCARFAALCCAGHASLQPSRWDTLHAMRAIRTQPPAALVTKRPNPAHPL